MNEQLVVKNFGPIKDATVDFKRVTVFIGPTGGGKSTLAKLAAIFREPHYNVTINRHQEKHKMFADFSLANFNNLSSDVSFSKGENIKFIDFEDGVVLGTSIISELDLNKTAVKNFSIAINRATELMQEIKSSQTDVGDKATKSKIEEVRNLLTQFDDQHQSLKQTTRELLYENQPHFFPANRNLLPAVEYSWAGLIRDDIGLPKDTLDFANEFSLSRKNVLNLAIAFLNVEYIHRNGQDFIKTPESETLFRLYETASGIQSVTPLLVLLEHLSRNTEQAQSFIIEEPELNLFPTAQFELVKILVDKCARLEGQNDLVLTTHSPYVLTALNLLCYAFRIAQQDEATARKVAKLIPRHCWIDPAQFAAYYVDLPGTKRKQQVRSIINKKTGLIEENELDTASDELSSIFDKLVRLHKPATTPTRAK